MLNESNISTKEAFIINKNNNSHGKLLSEAYIRRDNLFFEMAEQLVPDFDEGDRHTEEHEGRMLNENCTKTDVIRQNIEKK